MHFSLQTHSLDILLSKGFWCRLLHQTSCVVPYVTNTIPEVLLNDVIRSLVDLLLVRRKNPSGCDFVGWLIEPLKVLRGVLLVVERVELVTFKVVIREERTVFGELEVVACKGANLLPLQRLVDTCFKRVHLWPSNYN